jgi:hypothetical protein
MILSYQKSRTGDSNGLELDSDMNHDVHDIENINDMDFDEFPTQ